MKWKAYAIATCVTAVFASCGNNSSDKETTTTGDTSQTTTVDPGLTTTDITVPANTRTIFDSTYPQASNIRWQYHKPDMEGIDWELAGWPTLDTADYTAQFQWQGSDYRAWYDDQGNWVGTVNVINDPSSLPAPVSKAVTSQYSTYTVVGMNRENDKNRTAYEIELEKGSERIKVLMDENGKVIKKKTVTPGGNTKEKMNPKDTAM